MFQPIKNLVVPAAVSFWVLAVAAGLFGLARYEHTPGTLAAPAEPERWPAGSSLARDARRPTLVMSIHPQCPCSRASVEQLDRIIARCGGRVSSQVLAVSPPGAPRDFADTGLVRAVRALPGVRVVADADGAESRRFGAETSGHVCLYAPDGRLLFSGGVTAARGHAGDSAGAEAVIVALLGDGGGGGAPSGTDRTAVFGCPLTDERQPAATGCVVQEAPKTCAR